MTEHWQEAILRRTEKERRSRQILGVSIDADLKEIKKAFWLLAMQYHPDKNPRNKEAHKTFLNIINAYEFLTKGESRGWDPAGKDASPEEKRIGDYMANNWGYFCWWRENYHVMEETMVRKIAKRSPRCSDPESCPDDR